MQNKKKEINWGPAIFLILYQAILLVSLPFYFYYNTPSVGMIITSVILLYLTGLSITAGYHRFYSHRSYKTNRGVEFFLLFFGSMATQASALRWSCDHRRHHAHVDTDEDPYSIKKGFWYAHFTWMLEKPRPIDPKIVSDLLKNKMVMFQDRYYKLLMLGTNALAFFFVGWMTNDYLGAFVISLWLRIFFLHHFTWFINSLAHTWGEKPFCLELSAVDNYFLSMLTFGEGYHNYHHTFANDYRNGIRWFHFDPTKWLIWTLHKLGLAHSLKKMDSVTIDKRVVLESKSMMLQQLKDTCQHKKEELEKLINDLSEKIVAKIAEFNQLKQEYLENKQKRSPHIKTIKYELKNLKRSLKHDWKEWISLSKDITRGRLLPA